MGKIMYMNKEFQGRIPRTSGEIIYEEDYDYEWDFTRNDHPELDINHGEPIMMKNPEYMDFLPSGLQIGKITQNNVIKAAAIAVPLGNTNSLYWPYPTHVIGKTIEIDIVELLALRKPDIPSGTTRKYHRMFMYNGNDTVLRNANGGYVIDKGFTSDSGLIYTQKSTPQESGWCTYDGNGVGGWSPTLTPETVAYDSIGYFNGKTLKFEFTTIAKGAYNSSAYLYRIYVDDVLLTTKSYYKNKPLYLYYFSINPYGTSSSDGGMQGTIISGVRVYKNEWYEPKFQPES